MLMLVWSLASRARPPRPIDTRVVEGSDRLPASVMLDSSMILIAGLRGVSVTVRPELRRQRLRNRHGDRLAGFLGTLGDQFSRMPTISPAVIEAREQPSTASSGRHLVGEHAAALVGDAPHRHDQRVGMLEHVHPFSGKVRAMTRVGC